VVEGGLLSVFFVGVLHAATATEDDFGSGVRFDPVEARHLFRAVVPHQGLLVRRQLPVLHFVPLEPLVRTPHRLPHPLARIVHLHQIPPHTLALVPRERRELVIPRTDGFQSVPMVLRAPYRLPSAPLDLRVENQAERPGASRPGLIPPHAVPFHPGERTAAFVADQIEVRG